MGILVCKFFMSDSQEKHSYIGYKVAGVGFVNSNIRETSKTVFM